MGPRTQALPTAKVLVRNLEPERAGCALQARLSRWMAFAGRLFTAERCLLFLLGALLITMPLTQHLWAWDHFLRGGQDFEFGALAILLFLALALVLPNSYNQAVQRLLADRCGQGAGLIACQAAAAESQSALWGLPANSDTHPALRNSSNLRI